MQVAPREEAHVRREGEAERRGGALMVGGSEFHWVCSMVCGLCLSLVSGFSV